MRGSNNEPRREGSRVRGGKGSMEGGTGRVEDGTDRVEGGIEGRTERDGGGTDRVEDGTDRVEGGTERAEDRAERVEDGTDRVEDGTDRVEGGTESRTERDGDGTERAEDRAERTGGGTDRVEDGTISVEDGTNRAVSGIGRAGDKAGRVEVDRESIRKCLSSECSSCRENCPAYIAFQLDSYSSRGKNRALEAYEQGELKANDLSALVYACTTCGQCAEVCLTGGSIYDQVLELRNQMVSCEIEAPGLGEMAAYIREKRTPFSEKDVSWMEERDRNGTERKGKFAYFPGCSIQAELPGFASRTSALLKELGVDPVPLSNPCCGYPVLNAGFVDDARSMALDFLEEIKRRKIKTIITSCAGCNAMLRLHYPVLFGVHLRVLHITEFLSNNLKKLTTHYGARGKGRQVLYHDPCDLARKLDIIDEPRSVIEALGYRIKEFSRNRKETACCGGGGGFPREFPEKAAAVAERRIQEAKVGGTKIVTACLNCRRMLRTAGKGELEVLDIIELF